MTLDFAAMAVSAVKVLVVGVVLGAGLPALYAFGIKLQSIGSGDVDGSGAGTKNATYTVLAWIIFGVVLAVIFIAILFLTRTSIYHYTGISIFGAGAK